MLSCKHFNKPDSIWYKFSLIHSQTLPVTQTKTFPEHVLTVASLKTPARSPSFLLANKTIKSQKLQFVKILF
jgi:hypothetical protein